MITYLLWLTLITLTPRLESLQEWTFLTISVYEQRKSEVPGLRLKGNWMMVGVRFRGRCSGKPLVLIGHISYIILKNSDPI